MIPKGPTTRLVVCALLILSLCAPILAIAGPGAERNGESDVRALSALSQSALLTGAGARPDHARQRPVAPSVFILVPLHRADSDRGRLDAAIESVTRPSLWAAGPRTVRGPPIS
jgi:hypothetical protein